MHHFGSGEVGSFVVSSQGACQRFLWKFYPPCNFVLDSRCSQMYILPWNDDLNEVWLCGKGYFSLVREVEESSKETWADTFSELNNLILKPLLKLLQQNGKHGCIFPAIHKTVGTVPAHVQLPNLPLLLLLLQPACLCGLHCLHCLLPSHEYTHLHSEEQRGEGIHVEAVAGPQILLRRAVFAGHMALPSSRLLAGQGMETGLESNMLGNTSNADDV